MQPTSVIGHRGACGYAPENTLASIETAARLGLLVVEFDVKLAADGTPFVIHDDTLERTTGASGSVAEATAAELAALDAGSWFDAAFAGEPIPTLGAVLDRCDALGLEAICEIKPCPGVEAETGRVVARAVAERGRHSVSSFSTTTLGAALAAAPDVPRALLVVILPGRWDSVACELKCESVHVWAGSLTVAAIDSVKNTGRSLCAYTVNDPERARFLVETGVDAVFSDRPDRVLAS